MDAHRLGVFGEEMTAAEYRRLKYSIVATNFHSRFGEIDIIAQKGKLLVYIEVRTRDAGTAITPAETVDEYKQQRIRLTAEYFISQFPELADFDMRFDVVEMYYEGHYNYRMNRIENAF